MEHLELVNPAQLTIDANVRADVQLDKEFLASIKEHGVLQPVIAQRKESGGIHVLFGQRRTLAAVENNLTQIPVYIVDSLNEADRMAKQIVENDQRQALTEPKPFTSSRFLESPPRRLPAKPELRKPSSKPL